MTYEEKKEIADKYINDIIGLSWNDLGDTNSLHDCEDKESIIEACDERMQNDYMT